jgi:hypothetical protein
VRRIELQLGIEPSHYEPGAVAPPAADPAVTEKPSAPDRKALEV